MFKFFPSRLRGPYGIGAGLGMLVGIGMLLGTMLAISLSPWTALETSLEAAASTGNETMAMATGPIDEGVEGLFVLDFITSELTCQVVNPRTGQLGGLFRRNVAQDLGIEQGKQPKYLLVTGALVSRQNIGNVKPANSIVYVADVNTGKYVAYMLPWTRQGLNFNRPIASQMIPVGGGSARNVAIENQ